MNLSDRVSYLFIFRRILNTLRIRKKDKTAANGICAMKMSEGKGKMNKERDGSVNNVPQPKRQRMETQMKITELNPYCLTRIFLDLNIDDLLNIADANKELKSLVDSIFIDEFSKKTFDLTIESRGPIKMCKMREKSISIYDVYTSLRVLRCFGSLISKITITSTYTPIETVINYVNQYCNKTLNAISINNIFHKHVLDLTLKKPYLNLKTLDISSCVLGTEIVNFNQWFPELRSLKLSYCQVTNATGIVQCFPHLKELALLQLNKQCVTFEIVREIYQKNPQLLAISLDQYCLMEIIRVTSQYLPALEHLALHGYLENTDSTDNISMDFESVKKLELNTAIFGPINEINLFFENLEEIILHFRHEDDMNRIIKFLTQHKHILKVNLVISRFQSEIKSIIRCIFDVLPILYEFNLISEPRFYESSPFVNFSNEFDISYHSDFEFNGQRTYCINLKRKL